jgi:hypothetical protein
MHRLWIGAVLVASTFASPALADCGLLDRLMGSALLSILNQRARTLQKSAETPTQRRSKPKPTSSGFATT